MKKNKNNEKGVKMKKENLNHIAIIGGGPGGLMLGLLLQQQGLPFPIYERGYPNMHVEIFMKTVVSYH